jgi:hypothetical protein
MATPCCITNSSFDLVNLFNCDYARLQNCHTTAYVVIDAETTEVKFVSEAFERRTGVPAAQATVSPIGDPVTHSCYAAQVPSCLFKHRKLSLSDLCNIAVVTAGQGSDSIAEGDAGRSSSR